MTEARRRASGTPCDSVFMAYGMLLLLVECYYCLWNVSIACGMLVLLVECYYCLWNVSIACGMLLLLVECYSCSWNGTIACGMLLLRVDKTFEMFYVFFVSLVALKKVFFNSPGLWPNGVLDLQ